MLIILQHYAHQKHDLQCIQQKAVHDRGCQPIVVCKHVAHVKTVGSVPAHICIPEKLRIMLALCWMLQSMYYFRYYAGITYTSLATTNT